MQRAYLSMRTLRRPLFATCSSVVKVYDGTPACWVVLQPAGPPPATSSNPGLASVTATGSAACALIAQQAATPRPTARATARAAALGRRLKTRRR